MAIILYKEKIRKANTGRKQSQEEKDKRALSLKKWWLTAPEGLREEFRDKMIGNTWAEGYKFTPEQRIKHRDAVRKYWAKRKRSKNGKVISRNSRKK